MSLWLFILFMACSFLAGVNLMHGVSWLRGFRSAERIYKKYRQRGLFRAYELGRIAGLCDPYHRNPYEG